MASVINQLLASFVVLSLTVFHVRGDSKTEALRRLQELNNVRDSIATLSNHLDGIHSDYLFAQKRWGQCALGGLPGHTCRLPQLESAIAASDWLQGPGYDLRKKRDTVTGKESAVKDRVVRLLDSLSTKKQAIEELIRLLDNMDTNVVQEQKRHCLNLGGHCSIEGAANLHDTFRYYNSHMSPGRRELDGSRDNSDENDSLLKKLMSR